MNALYLDKAHQPLFFVTGILYTNEPNVLVESSWSDYVWSLWFSDSLNKLTYIEYSELTDYTVTKEAEAEIPAEEPEEDFNKRNWENYLEWHNKFREKEDGPEESGIDSTTKASY